MTYYLPGMPRRPKALTLEEVDRRLSEWHSMDEADYEDLNAPSLPEYLGWSWAEYKRFTSEWELPSA